LPYGYHNFLFGWIDTPFDNLPPLLPNELVPIVMSLVSKVIPNEIKILFTDGLNKRLGTNGLSIEEVAALAAKREMEIQDLMALPE
jgi:hypothetical protein